MPWQILRIGAGKEVSGGNDLYDKISEILTDPEEALRLGAQGRKEILNHIGSAHKSAQILVTELSAE